VAIPEEPIDRENARDWAIASFVSGGAVVNFALFDLVNLETNRGHTLLLTSGGVSADLGEVSTSTGSGPGASYEPFRTRRPVSFHDFDWARGSLFGAGLAVVWGYSTTVLRIEDSRGPITDPIVFSGGGPGMAANVTLSHGICHVLYGDGSPNGSTRPAVIMGRISIASDFALRDRE
jgi:hypothetical protein